MPEITDILNAFVLLTNFVLLPALTYGSQLALGALGITLIYSILRFSNFAHGDLMAFGTMLVILITWLFLSVSSAPPGIVSTLRLANRWEISFGVLPTALLALPFAIVGTIGLSLVI